MEEPVQQLLSRLLPVVRDGGTVPLSAIAEATLGERLSPQVKGALDARKELRFRSGDDVATFENAGREVKVRLKSCTLKVPERLGGSARVLGDGVVLRFDGERSLRACKAFFCVRLERIEVTPRRVFVDLEGDSLDQCYVLDA